MSTLTGQEVADGIKNAKVGMLLRVIWYYVADPAKNTITWHGNQQQLMC